MKEQPNKETYTRRGHIRGGDIHTEGIFTRRGHTHGGDIHMEGTYMEGTCIRKGSAHEGSYTRRDIHMDEHTYGGEMHMKGHTHGGDIYIVQTL